MIELQDGRIVTQWWRRIDQWMFASIDPRQIAALRIGLATILLIRLWRHDFGALSDEPEGLYRPLSYMNIFDEMPSDGVWMSLLAIASVSALSAAVGYRSRLMLPVAVTCSLVLFGMTTSLGKVMHNDALLVLSLLPIAIGTTDDVWSVTAWRRRRSRNISRLSKRHLVEPVEPTAHAHGHTSGWPWRLILLLVCGAYFFSGLAKLTHSGFDWVFSDNMRWILYANSDGRAVPNQVSLFIADHPWLARTSGAGIFALEIGFPLVLWRATLRWLFVPAAIAMHILTWLTLGLDYSAMAAVVVVTMVFWPAVADFVRLRRTPIEGST